MIIRSDQMNQMQAAFDASQARDFAARLRQVYPSETADVSAEDLLAGVESDLRLAAALGFDDDDDLWRFVQLRYWPVELLSQEHLQSTILIVLTRTEWPAAKRLNFLERHVRTRVAGAP